MSLVLEIPDGTPTAAPCLNASPRRGKRARLPRAKEDMVSAAASRPHPENAAGQGAGAGEMR